MNTVSAYIQYRPVRIGFCIRENNFKDYRKALRLTHTLWGGRYNPIIPIGSNFEIASKLVESFKVDVLYPIENDIILTDFVKKFSYLPWPLHCSEKLFVKTQRSYEPAFLDIYQAVLRLSSDLIKYNHRDTWQLNLLSWSLTDPLSDIFEAMFGAYPSTEDINIDYDGLVASRLNINSISLSPEKEVPQDVFKHTTKNQLTTHLLCGGKQLNYPGLYAGSVDNFFDLVNFWNMRACGISLLFYDPNYCPRLENIKNAYLEELRNQPNYSENGLGVWSTAEKISSLDINLFGKDLVRCTVSQHTFNEFNTRSFKRFFKGKTVLGVLSDLSNHSLSFQLPEKPIVSEAIGNFQHLIASIKVFGSISMDERQTFQVPYIPELNIFYGQEMHIFNETRVEPEGLGFITQVDENNLYLRSIDVKKLIQRIFKHYGMIATPSKPGLIASRIIQQFGGLRECRVFKINGVRKLLAKDLTQEFTRQSAHQIIGQNDPLTGAPNFSKYENLYITKRPVGVKLTAHQVFDYLAEKEIFRVGLRLKCSSCDLQFWRAFDDVNSKAICEYCGAKFNILPQLKDRDYFFRRSGIFGHNDHQEGGIPVVLTLHQLHANFHFDNFLYTTAMNIVPDGADIKKCETDFVVVTWNRFGEVSIIISECKTKDVIDASDAENLKKVADSLSKNCINAYILFSKLDTFSDVEVDICMKAQGNFCKRVIMLTDNELESMHIYEDLKDKFEIEAAATDWAGMAFNTAQIYIDKKIKISK